MNMLPKINPTTTEAWQQLQEHFAEMKEVHLVGLFKADPERYSKFSMCVDDIVFDYSKNIISEKTKSLLLQLADECRLKDAMEAMYNGELINETERRAVLHTALRNFSGQPVFTEGNDVMPEVKKMLRRMKNFCKEVHSGHLRGYTGKKIKYIVNIGIGGSDLGPLMVTEALKPYWVDDIQSFFVSNVDGSHIAETWKKINPERTLFLIASKTFTTQETMTNAYTAREWFLKKAKNEKHIARHFVALSAHEQEALKFGIDKKNIFGFRDWVGGRFSLWSSVGLSIALTTGFKNFELLLKGAFHIDNHFRKTSFDKNIPVLMAMIGIWYRNFFSTQSEAVLPYDQYLHRFPAYLQQAVMESNGKNADRNGEPVDYMTSPVIWGEPGTNGQHAFYQLLHQGTMMIPCDFIATAQNHHAIGDHHQKLLANFFAQTEALMNGKTEDEAISEMKKQGLTDEQIAKLLPFKIFPGNKPGNSILLKKLTPYTLGELVALYEHKIFVQGVIWNIFSFDQWGVELGKQLANTILPELMNKEKIKSHDASTNGLINAFKKMRK
jgi:glucose-6-phosphate isomerase